MVCRSQFSFEGAVEDSSECSVEEVGGGGLGGGEPGFQRVAPAHQLVHLRHNPLLFGERGNQEFQFSQILQIQSRLRPVDQFLKLAKTACGCVELEIEPRCKRRFSNTDQSYMLADVGFTQVLFYPCRLTDTRTSDHDQQVILLDAGP